MSLTIDLEPQELAAVQNALSPKPPTINDLLIRIGQLSTENEQLHRRCDTLTAAFSKLNMTEVEAPAEPQVGGSPEEATNNLSNDDEQSQKSGS